MPCWREALLNKLTGHPWIYWLCVAHMIIDIVNPLKPKREREKKE
jgi:hypothetical protein